jgi:preprotein translocase subunit SecG
VDVSDFLPYLQTLQIILAVALIVVILLQTPSMGLGGIFGGDSTVARSRRGVEKTLYHITIGLSIAFFLISLITVIVA